MRTETDRFRLNFLRWGPQRAEPCQVNLTYEEIPQAKGLSEASRLLIVREERLFGEEMEPEAFKHHEEEVNKLEADRRALQDLVLQTLVQALSLGEDCSEVLTSAVKAVTQEEDQDRQWTQRKRTPPAWRPSGWKALHDSALLSLVEERMDNPTCPPADQVKRSAIQAEVNSMGRQLKEDLLYVVDVVMICYPPELDICNFYAKLYHQAFRARLVKIADFELVDRDHSFLLLWANTYYPQILQKPQLASKIDIEALGKLLPKELLEHIEDQYLSQKEVDLAGYIDKEVKDTKQKCNEGKEPTTKDVCFICPVYLIPVIYDLMTSAITVVGDQQKVKQITYQLKDLMQRFKSFQNDVMKRDKPNSRSVIKANLNGIEQFRDFFNTRGHLFTEDVQENCLHVLTDMKQSANTYLLKSLHIVLMPEYRKLGRSDWLKNPQFDGLLDGIKKELHGLNESCHQTLVGQLHQEVTVEYVRRLLKGKLKLKDMEQQQKAYETMKEDAESLHDLFVEMGSREDWLKEILTMIAELLKLQGLPAIQIQVVSLGTAYPDLSEKHVSALLKLKTNLSRANRKTVKVCLSDTLKEIESNTDTRPFFSRVRVK